MVNKPHLATTESPLADPDISGRQPVRKLRKIRDALGVKRRTCYDHLAGTLGMHIAEALVADGSLELRNREYHMSKAGVIRLAAIGLDVTEIIDATTNTPVVGASMS